LFQLRNFLHYFPHRFRINELKSSSLEAEMPLTFSIYLPPDLSEAVRAEADRRGSSVARVFRDSIVSTLGIDGYREIDRRRSPREGRAH